MEIDRVEEWRKLTERYAGMSDDELEAVAGDGWELTDVARQALQGEISSRGLNFRIAAAPAPPPPEPSEAAGAFDPADLELVVAQQVWDLSEARQVKEILDAAGIPCYWGANNVEDVDELGPGFEGGMNVKVRKADQQRAAQALAGARPAESQTQPDYTPRCPKCHSTEIVFQGLEGEPVEDSTANSKFNWSCDACGYTWKDDGVEQEA
jgi:DNA-directed RNA polymerase subunit M/transcription elongation factor TFIIS